MKALVKTAVLALALGIAAPASSFAHAHPMMGMMGGHCPMMGMMGGHCPMMGMMGPGMMGQGTMGQGMMGQGTMDEGMMDWHPDMAAVAVGHLAYLEAELGITESQMAAWNRYAEAAKERAAAMHGMPQGMMKAMDGGSMVERLDARIGAMEAMLDTLKAVRPAADELYTVLNDEQKKKADLLIAMPCGMM
jgi:hypothetical protein